MAKHLVQVVIAGAQVVGRAFARAVRQEYRASQQAAQRHGGGERETTKRAAADTYTGMSLQEAKEILNVEDIHNVEELQKQYDHLFAVNDKSKGGSLYLQSKVFRAKERMEMEMTSQAESNNGGDSEKPSPDS